MKAYKKIISLMLIAFISINISISIVAHQEMLLIEYDDCSGPTYDETGNLVTDGEDETWYWLEWSNSEYHISHTTQTIKYYFADYGKYDSSYTWTTDTTESEANDIKEAFANSMKKWNDIYYYSYDSNGNRTAHKVINVVEGSESDHNLIIHPAQSTTFAARVSYNDETTNILETNHNNINHYHPENWYIEVDVDSFVSSKSSASMFRERTGQHEVGHILGIYDVDVCCNATVSTYHHEEILMGYGNGERSTYAKYKDIAGVSITRGFHTDDNHIWMLRTNDDGTKDVICAQCNGVRKNITLTNGKYEGKTVNAYESCTHHGGNNQNMLLVATDGQRDFYKCQYCRYILESEHSNHYIYNTYSTTDSNYHTPVCIVCHQSFEPSEHTFEYVSTNEISRTKKCTECDYQVTEYHKFICNGFEGNNHFEVCADCGFVRIGLINPHYAIDDACNHCKQCSECGYSIAEAHTYIYKSNGNSGHTLTCKYCGDTNGVIEGHLYTAYENGGNYAKCKICGHLKHAGSGFIPIIKTKPIIIEEETE